MNIHQTNKVTTENLIGTVVIVWQLDLQVSVHSVPITTTVVSSNPAHGEDNKFCDTVCQ